MSELLPWEASNAVVGRVECIIADVIYGIGDGSLTDIKECLDFIDKTPDCDMAAVDLSLDDQFETIDALDPSCRTLMRFKDVRSKLEEMAAELICQEAKRQARTVFEPFAELVESYGLDLADAEADDRGLGHFRHYAEREVDGCTVYEYRNADGEVHIDLWHVHFQHTYAERTRTVGKLYIHQGLDADDLTPVELAFDAA